MWLPFGVSLVSAILIYIGILLGQGKNSSSSVVAPGGADESYSDVAFRPFSVGYKNGTDKLVDIMNMLQSRYVDTLNMSDVIEDAIPLIMGELDPHSVYIPAKDLAATNEQLDGSFSGIGVQFNIQNDTVMVVGVISGGPSEKVGIMPGDRIVSINDSAFVGKTINNERVFKTLRGEKGTHVKVGVRRASASDVLQFDIERGDIPVNSVMAAFIASPGVGYINVDNFGRNTYEEFYSALTMLNAKGAKGFIIDLRGNSGGYMEVCARMVNEFLGKGDLIVYTEGQTMSRSYMRSDGRGSFQKHPVVVLIDEWSASASEILAGAIQDNDRGMVVGRRSFGKGLVQQQFELNDGSALRLTVARYYTPSGRCIQKAYEMGEQEEYAMDIVHRYERGEFYSQDSIHFADSLKYTTRQGREVYGGGGIMPDIFIPSDSTGITPYYTNMLNLGLFYSFAFRYADTHREQLAQFTTFEDLDKHIDGLNLTERLVEYASDKVKPNAKEIAVSRRRMQQLLKAYVMRQVFSDNYFYRAFYADDPGYLKAIELIQQGKAMPEIQ